MSSGERAKPPTTYEERNPFDVSRRSQTEVAGEIAKRMAAWKQARGRSYATSTAPAESPAKEDATRPLGAPVQPARMPQSAAPLKQPADPSAGEVGSAGRETRAPFFATFSIQRAMPPAPSPKPSASESEAAIAAGEDQDSGSSSRGQVQEAPSQTPDPEPPAAAALAADGPAEAPEPDTQPEAAPASRSTEPADPNEADSLDARRARALEIKSRWMQAHDFEEPRAAESPRAGHQETAAATEPGEERPDQSIGPAPHLAIPPIEALDELSGRREPTLDTPTGVRAGKAAAPTPGEPPVAEGSAASEPAGIASGVPPIERLDEMSGRKEPVFDQLDEPQIAPAAAEPPVITAPAQEAAAPRRNPHQAADWAGSPDPESSRRVARLDRALSRRKTEPMARPTPAPEAPASKRAVDLPAMQTRIEARRMDTLRADPELAVRRPVFPHIEPEAWEVASVIHRPARRERRGTGWAIGLGAALLIIGITAPAAILRQGIDRAPTDQDVAIGPLPAEEGQPEARDPVQSAAQATPPVRSQPQASTPAEPAESGPEPRMADAQEGGAPANKPEAGADSAEQQATLSAVGDGGALEEVPVTAPPPPWKSAQVPLVNLASQDKSRPSGAPYRPSPKVARPFVPDHQVPEPFLPAPDSAMPVPDGADDAAAPRTVGGVTVELDPPAAQPQGASIGVRPNLIPQLKPKAAPRLSGAAAPKKIARKPKPFVPQSLEQMFEELVDSLSEGRPPNPALRPIPPSSRK